MMQIGNHTELVFEEGLVRHMILNSLRLYKQKFGGVYGNMVIACDDKQYWRKDLFPYYKAGRKKFVSKVVLNGHWYLRLLTRLEKR